MSEAYDRELAKQQKAWPIHLKGGAQGNPYATLCLSCHGRHAPPRDSICPQTKTVKS